MVASTAQARSSPSSTSPAPTRRASKKETSVRRTLAVLHVLVAAAAVLGGFALIRDPSGSLLRLTPAELSGFTSFAIPGVLLVIFGVVQLAAGGLVARPGPGGLVASQAGGALLVLWTAFQSTLTIPVHPLQLVTLLTGAVIFIVAHELHRSEPHKPLLP